MAKHIFDIKRETGGYYMSEKKTDHKQLILFRIE